MLKIKDNIDLKELEKFGFEKDKNYRCCSRTQYVYEFLAICPNCRSICIISGIDEVNGDSEIIKLFDLIKADLVEKVEGIW